MVFRRKVYNYTKGAVISLHIAMVILHNAFYELNVWVVWLLFDGFRQYFSVFVMGAAKL